jgi:ABC-2 type transport system ATP-binding protein
MSIEVSSVTKTFGAQKALDKVSFTVNTGEIVGFLGPNGAGKSTMMKIITGFIPPDSGTVFLNSIQAGDDNKEIKRITGYLPENNPLYPEMYVREYLAFVYSTYFPSKPPSPAVDSVISLTGLLPEQNKKIGSLSKGYRQRVGLAQALIHNPDILILDEATSGLDPNQIIEIRNLIRTAGKDKTILLSTHIMQEVEAICDRIIIIDRGRIVANEKKESIYSKVKQQIQVVLVEFNKDPDVSQFEKAIGAASATKTGNEWEVRSQSGSDIRGAIFNFAVANGLTVLSLRNREDNLEEVFRKLTSS